MTKEDKVHKKLGRTQVAWLLIILGVLLVIVGLMLYLNSSDGSNTSENQETDMINDNDFMIEDTSQDASDSNEKNSMDDSTDTELSEPSQEKEDPDTSDQIDVMDSQEAPDHMDATSFTGLLKAPIGMSYRLLDGVEVDPSEVPGYHRVSEINISIGTNPARDYPSEVLKVILSAVPDREFNVAVLVSPLDQEITAMSPDQLLGLQWTLSYYESAFHKSERQVETDEITPLTAESFNILYEGKETYAEVQFFGPLDTEYYAVMLYDEEYFTIILPTLEY